MSISRRGLLHSAVAALPFAVSPAQTRNGARPPGRLKVVVSGGHPGDPECGCGGTIARYTALGHEVVLLDVGGREVSTREFAEFLGRRLSASSSSLRGVAFVVGGHQGVDEETRQTADHIISLSRMTLPHEMARLVLVEQIYRVMTILRGGRYHR